MSKTKIEWSTDVWNPVVGCDRVSDGCRNCYAETMSKRLAGVPHSPQYDDVIGENGTFAGGSVNTMPDKLEEPLHWRKPRRVFVNSMSDLFHPDVPFEFVDDVFSVMARSQVHTFQILTKRPERMAEYLMTNNLDLGDLCPRKNSRFHKLRCREELHGITWPLPNVWLGVSVEDQETADERIPPLLECPAVVRFLSCEPLLDQVSLNHIPHPDPEVRDAYFSALDGEGLSAGGPWTFDVDNEIRSVDWVIAGGESGPGARPSHPDWFRQLRDQCQEAGVPFFFKQHGAWTLCSWDETNTGIDKDGNIFEGNLPNDPLAASMVASGFTPVKKVGKTKAGRELDGETWDQFPESPGTKKDGRSVT